MNNAIGHEFAASSLRLAKHHLNEVAAGLVGGRHAAIAPDVGVRVERVQRAVLDALLDAPDLFTQHGADQARAAVAALDPVRDGVATGASARSLRPHVEAARDALRDLRTRTSATSIARHAHAAAPEWAAARRPTVPVAAVAGGGAATVARTSAEPTRTTMATPLQRARHAAATASIGDPIGDVVPPPATATQDAQAGAEAVTNPTRRSAWKRWVVDPIRQLFADREPPVRSVGRHRAPDPLPSGRHRATQGGGGAAAGTAATTTAPQPSPAARTAHGVPSVSAPRPEAHTVEAVALPTRPPLPDVIVPRREPVPVLVPGFGSGGPVRRRFEQAATTPQVPWEQRSLGQRLDPTLPPPPPRAPRAPASSAPATASASVARVPDSPADAPPEQRLAELMAVATAEGASSVRERVQRIDDLMLVVKLRDIGIETLTFMKHGLVDAGGPEGNLAGGRAIALVDGELARRVQELRSR